MTDNKENMWQLPDEEVSCGTTASTVTHRKRLTRASRSVDDSGCEVRLTHIPSGIEVKDDIPVGRYSRKQMRQKINELKKSLRTELEKKVLKHRKELRKKSF